MKKIFLILILSTQSVWGQSVIGSWSGTLKVMGTELPLVFHVIEKEGSLNSTMDSPKQGAMGIPVSETTFENNLLTFNAKSLGLKYVGSLKNGDTLEGTFSQGGMNIPLLLVRGEIKESVRRRPQEPQVPYPYFTRDVTLKNEKEGNLLAGSIFAPSDSKEIPVLVMITGSGLQNRDEELFGHKPFLVIADYLARNGIATLRLDDRGIDGSEMGKYGPTSEDFAGDISSAVNFLFDQGYRNIGLIGHSEGGMIAPMVYGMNKKVKFMVLLAGPGIPIPELMKLQTYRVSLAMGSTEADAREAAESNQKLYSYINQYKGKNFEKDLSDFLRSQNPGMEAQQLKASVDQVNNPWFKYFLAFNPDKYLKKVKVPVLALNGDKDVQVTAKENLAGIQQSLRKARNKNFEIVEMPGLNHLFQTAKTGSIAEYVELEETISPAVLEKIVEWMKTLK